MALDKAYFDSINIDVAKKKYYNVNKVEAVLQDIRREAEALNEENASLRREVERMNGEKRSVGDALISARELAQQIISGANAQADETVRSANARAEEIIRAAREKAAAETGDAGKIIDEANARAEEIIQSAQEQRDRITAESQEQENYAAKYVLDTFEHLKERQLETIRQLNEDYQKFLCGLFPDDEAEGTAYEAPAPKEDEPEADELESMETVPEDLREKVSAIAKALRAIDGD